MATKAQKTVVKKLALKSVDSSKISSLIASARLILQLKKAYRDTDRKWADLGEAGSETPEGQAWRRTKNQQGDKIFKRVQDFWSLAKTVKDPVLKPIVASAVNQTKKKVLGDFQLDLWNRAIEILRTAK